MENNKDKRSANLSIGFPLCHFENKGSIVTLVNADLL